MDIIDRDALLGLPNLERAEEMSRLLERHNWEQKDLAKCIGLSIDKTSRYLMPIKLCREAKDSIRLLPKDKRPPLGSVELLCRLTPELQQEFLRILPLHLPERKQIDWLRDQFVTRGVELSKSKLRRKYRISRFALRFGTVSRSVRHFAKTLSGMTAEGRKKALAIEEYPERNQLFHSSTKTLIEELQVLEKLLVFSEEVGVFPALEVVAQKLEEAPKNPEPVVVKKQHNPKFRTAVVQTQVTSAPVKLETTEFLSDINVTYWDGHVLRLVTGKVTPRRYVELARKGELKYQQQRLTRPDYLPDPEEVAEKLGLKL